MKWLGENKKELAKVKKSFPITEDEMHDVCHWYGVDAWVSPDDEDWKETGIFDQEDDMEEMFGLPPGANMDDGCFEFGYASFETPPFLLPECDLNRV